LASRTPRPFTTYKLVSRSTLNETPSKILRYLPGCSYQPYQPSQQSQAYLVHIHPSTVLLCLASGCQVLHPLSRTNIFWSISIGRTVTSPTASLALGTCLVSPILPTWPAWQVSSLLLCCRDQTTVSWRHYGYLENECEWFHGRASNLVTG